MDTAAAALLLLLHTAAALQVLVPKTHTARLGTNVQMPCLFTVDEPPVDRTLLGIIWYFQGKQVLRVIGQSEDTTNPRLSYVDGAWRGGAGVLISNTTVSDGGLYTCSVLYGSQRKEGEIRLDIQAPPQVTITGKTVVLNEESVLRCSVTGFYPVDIGIKWFRGTQMLRDATEDEPQRNSDGSYSVNSTATITATEEDREQIFSCRVQHESLQQPLQEKFQLLYGAIPTVHILPHIFKKNIEQILVCLVSGFYPESIVVNWVLDGTPVKKTETKRINISIVEAILHFTPTQKNWGKKVSCMVEHETLRHPLVKSLTVFGKDLKANHKPLVVTAAILLSALLGAGTISFYVCRYRQKRQPKLRNITHTTDGSFSLNVDHFYPKDVSVTWEVFQPPSSNNPQSLQSTGLMQENQDGTFNVTSTTESLRDKVTESEEYILRAVVTHQKLKRPSYREWSNKNKDKLDNTSFRSSPELSEILTPNLMLNREAQLQCTISHFYPDCLIVNWIRKMMSNEEIIQTSEKYKILSHRSQQQHDKTFTCTACLVFTPSMEDQGSEIICRVTHPTLEQPAERSTGHLQVLVKPTVDGPVQLTMNESGDVTATLLLLKFYPKDITITWTYDRSQEKRPSEETPTAEPDGTFSTTTQCTIPRQLFKEEDFIIKITWKHEAMDLAESREMSMGHPDYPWCPRIIDMTPLILQLGSATTVTCKISTFISDNLKTIWYEKKGASLIPCVAHIYNTSHIQERMTDNSYICSASLSFTAQSQSDDLEFICRVFHPSLKNPIDRSTGKATKRVSPQMEMPVKFTISGSDAVTCSMSLMKFHPSDIKILWTNEDKVIPSTRKLIQTDDEQTFDAISDCTVPWTYFTPGVRVTWEHESLPSPQHRDLRVEDLPWCPLMEEIDRPVFRVNTEATLQCKISQYYPKNLSVTWYMKKEGDVITTERTPPTAQRQRDNTYSCTASLVVTPSVEEHDGAEIICRVQHPRLSQYAETSTGPIQVYASPRIQDPLQWSLSPRGEVLCTLILQSFYPRPIDIKWSCNPNCSFTSSESDEVNKDSTYNVRSDCTVSQEEINHPNFRITVTWSHSSMAELGKREMCIKDAGLPWHLTVSDMVTPVLVLHQEVTLRCDIGGHFLRTRTVSWFVKERRSDRYVPVEQYGSRYHSEIMKEQYSDAGYQATASLRFLPSLGHHHGVWFMCRVQHPSLELPIKRPAGPLLMSLTPELREQKIRPYNRDEVLYSVALKKFFPKAINVTWKNGDSCLLASMTVLQANDEEDEAFDAISQCRIPRADLRCPVQVTWEHSSMAEPHCLQLLPTA